VVIVRSRTKLMYDVEEKDERWRILMGESWVLGFLGGLTLSTDGLEYSVDKKEKKRKKVNVEYR
jgi:hypothetical protein